VKRVLPILVSIFLVILFGLGAYYYLDDESKSVENLTNFQGDFTKTRTCKQMPLFLARLSRRGVYIDLSQLKYKGIAFWYGKGFRKVLHKKEWEKFGYFGTYTADKNGDLFLAPSPFITIEKDTFEAQKWIYKLDGKTGKLSKWLKLEDVSPSKTNPYGIISLDYDCDDNSLWVSTIDQSSYQNQRGKIYKIDLKSKKILKKYEGYDFFTIKILKTTKGKYLLGGLAMSPALFAWEMKDGFLAKKPQKLFELPNSTLRIRKIHIISKNRLKLEAVPFTYSLIAQTAKKYREYFIALWDSIDKEWIVGFKK
jgi:hypothetical protein